MMIKGLHYTSIVYLHKNTNTLKIIVKVFLNKMQFILMINIMNIANKEI